MGLHFGSVVMLWLARLWFLPGAFRLPVAQLRELPARDLQQATYWSRAISFHYVLPGGAGRPRLDPGLLEEEHGGQRDPEQ